MSYSLPEDLEHLENEWNYWMEINKEYRTIPITETFNFNYHFYEESWIYHEIFKRFCPYEINHT